MTQRESRPKRRGAQPMTPGIPRGARIRAYLAGVTLSIGIFGLAWRAWAVQIDDNDHYRTLAGRQHALSVEIPAPRGDIRDRHGEPLAASADADSIWANPREIKDVTATADKLAQLMHVDAATLEAKLGTGKKFVWLDRHVDASIAAAVKAAKLPGIEIAKEPKRWYPSRSLAGAIIGRADIDGNGLDGVELAMNAYLTGTRGTGNAVRDARGRRTFADGLAQPEQGGTVKLTLDRHIQAIAESALSESVIGNKAQSGVAVVLEVATGKVLGMATYPVYDPNRPEGVGNARNRPVTDAFEAGSVMKLFTIAAALDNGTVSPDTGFDINGGSLMIPGRKTPIRDVHPKKNYLTVGEIIKHSSNVGSTKIAQRLGKEAFYTYFRALGFGAKTGIELPGEAGRHAPQLHEVARRRVRDDGVRLRPDGDADPGRGCGRRARQRRHLQPAADRRRDRGTRRARAEQEHGRAAPRVQVEDRGRSAHDDGDRVRGREALRHGLDHRRPRVSVRRQDGYRAQVGPGREEILGAQLPVVVHRARTDRKPAARDRRARRRPGRRRLLRRQGCRPGVREDRERITALPPRARSVAAVRAADPERALARRDPAEDVHDSAAQAGPAEKVRLRWGFSETPQSARVSLKLASLHEIGELVRSIVMTLRDLIDGLPARLIGDGTVAVGSVRNDNREIVRGDVFVAVRGMRADGHTFVADAVAKGAAAIVVEREMPGVAVPQVVVENTAKALGRLVARSLGDPAKRLTLIGITGTNGKTTTTFLVESILAAAGHVPGVIGTVTYRWPGTVVDAPYTTPTPQVLHETFAKMVAAGVTHVVMEVSSIALSMDRVAGIDFAVAAFSNLTQDHLDVHGTMEAYRDAKRRLFSDHNHGGTAVVNIDDREGDGMATASPGRVLRVTAAGKDADIRVVSQSSTVRGITGTIATPRGDIAIEARPLIGHYNVENLALATGIGEALGLAHEAIARGIAALPVVPGRVERVANDADLDIVVDYAHTPDALRNVLVALRPLTKRRLICVFGCGGDRDPTKRPKMGAAVAELADLAIVTSDNPRTEDPRSIIDQILPAVPRPHFVDVDRRVAIRAAISEATPGDVVVIAGKGHEDYQILGTTKHHFDDREEAKAAVLDRWRRTQVALADDCGGALRGGVELELDAPQNRGSVPAYTEGYCTRVIIDSRLAAPGDLYVAVRGGNHDGHQFCAEAIRAGATAIVVDTADRTWAPVEPSLIAADLADLREGGKLRAGVIVVEDTRIAIGEIAQSHRRRWAGKLVAVTGSAGKTTTKELVRSALGAAAPTHAADGSLNNETGVPLTLLGLRPYHAFAVVEMGMRGKGQIKHLTKMAEPDVAVIVNAGTAHIELLGSTDAIAEAKAEIWIGLREGGTIVRPSDDPRLESHARRYQPRARYVTFGEHDADVQLIEYTPIDAQAAPGSINVGSRILVDVFGSRQELVLQLVGKHAAIDACAAIAAAHAAGASLANVLAGLARARPPSMRGEIVVVHGRHVIVDCYNANPASMAAALRSLAERAQSATGLAIVGDMLELGDLAKRAHAETGALARELGLGVIALGDHARTVVDAAGGARVGVKAGTNVQTAEVSDSPAAAAACAFARTKPGDWILLKASRGMKLERVLQAMRETREA